MRATVLALLALLVLPASALASDEVRVEPEGASARAFTLSGLGEPDVRERVYSVDGAQVKVTGWSLDRVLRAGRADPYRFGALEIALTGGTVALSSEETTDPEAFPDGPPVFWVEEGQARFLRPAGADGTPAQLVAGGPVTVSLSRASELAVSVTASTRRTKPGRPVTFTASVSGAGAGEQVEISWYFDDGQRAAGRRVTHRFRKPGTYDVVVGATTRPDEPGADASVTVQVGKPPRGPDRKGGGTSNDSDAPDSGVAEGGGSPGGDSSSDAPGGEAQPSQEEPAAREESPAREERPRRKRRSPEAGPAGRQVTGIELADLSALSSPAGQDAQRAARRGRLREEPEPGSGIPPALWWSLGAAALLGLGAWLEVRKAPARPAA